MTAKDQQVGGEHYRRLAFQPIAYILANGLGFVEGAVIKYVSRWKDKGGIEDLKKARHFLDLYIEHLERGGTETAQKQADISVSFTVDPTEKA